MPHPHRGSLRGGDTHLSCDLTLPEALSCCYLAELMVKKIESDIFTFHDCSVSHVQTVFSQSFPFFSFYKKKHWTANLSFCEAGLKNLFCWDFYSTPVLTVHFILFLFPFLFLLFFLLLARFCHLAVAFFFSAVWILASPLVPLWMWTKLFGPVTSLHREMRKVIWTRSAGCVCTLVQSRRFLAQNVTDGRINSLSCTILYWVLRNCPLISFYVLCWKLPLPLSSHKRARWDALAFFSPHRLLLLGWRECFRQRKHRTYLLAYLRNILS